MSLPKELASLKIEATKSTRAHGHRMRWHISRHGHDHLIGRCYLCHAWVILQPNPMPNETYISGTAVALDCRRSDGGA